MIALILAACLNGPYFPRDFSGPICPPDKQDEQCVCSECATWDVPADLMTVDGYQIARRVVGGDGIWRVVGFLPCNAAWCGEDGSCYPRVCRNVWCFAMDSPVPPMVNTLFEYTVRAVKGMEVSAWHPPFQYRGAPLDCWEGGWIPCFPGDQAQERL